MEAAHKEITLHGRAGHLEALLWTPDSEACTRISLAAVVCHPHPLYQGTMHNKVVYRIAKAFDSLGIPALRFNFRGVGASEGVYDHGRGEEEDVRTALEYLAAQFPSALLLVAGFSFGAWVGLRAGCADPRVSELIGLGLPIDDHKLSFDYLGACAKPKLLIQGENDQFAAKAHFESFFAGFNPEAHAATRVVFVGGDHFFKGHLDDMTAALCGWMISRHPELNPPSPQP